MIYLPHDIPASYALKTKSYEVKQWNECPCKNRILFLNLMPQKELTENDFARVLNETNIPVQLIPMKIRGLKYKNTPQSYMDKFYLDFEEFEKFDFQGLIITGAPIEQLQFEEVRYWTDLCQIMTWAESHVQRVLYICWGAQAGLFYHYGIPKYTLSDKKFGVFKHNVSKEDNPLMKDLLPSFMIPNSRHTEIHAEDVANMANGELLILAESVESGVGIIVSSDMKKTFVIGHLEYAPNTLHNEYQRDLKKHLPIKPPLHYYDMYGKIKYSWHDAGVIFYKNWLSLFMH